MIGLSLSFCVSDCLQGNVNPNDVTKVYASTRAKSTEVWEDIICSYRTTYWSNDPDKGEAICRNWLARGIIYQPLLTDNKNPSVSSGCWVDNETQIHWFER